MLQHPTQSTNPPNRQPTYDDETVPIQNIWLLRPLIQGTYALVSVSVFLIITHFFDNFEFIRLFVAFSVIINIIVTIILIVSHAIQRTQFHYEFQEDHLVIRQGILNKEERTIPYETFQNIIVHKDLTDVILGLSSVIIENASGITGSLTSTTLQFQNQSRRIHIGSSSNRVIIPGLNKRDSVILRNAILNKVRSSSPYRSQQGL